MDSLPLNRAGLQGAGGVPDDADACRRKLLFLPPESAECLLCGGVHLRRYINRAHPWINEYSLATLASALIAEGRRSGFPNFRYADPRSYACSEEEQACWDQVEARWAAAQGGAV